MTTAQIAQLLNVCPHTVTNHAIAKKIPGAFKLGRQWRFRKSDILEWLDEKVKEYQNNGKEQPSDA